VRALSTGSDRTVRLKSALIRPVSSCAASIFQAKKKKKKLEFVLGWRGLDNVGDGLEGGVLGVGDKVEQNRLARRDDGTSLLQRLQPFWSI